MALVAYSYQVGGFRPQSLVCRPRLDVVSVKRVTSIVSIAASFAGVGVTAENVFNECLPFRRAVELLAFRRRAAFPVRRFRTELSKHRVGFTAQSRPADGGIAQRSLCGVRVPPSLARFLAELPPRIFLHGFRPASCRDSKVAQLAKYVLWIPANETPDGVGGQTFINVFCSQPFMVKMLSSA